MYADSVRVVEGPAVEPVTLAEAKAHLRVDGDDENGLIARLISAARRQCELVARRAFTTQTLEATLNGWPGSCYVSLPMPPLVSVVSIGYTDQNGTAGTMPPAHYVVDTGSEPGLVMLAGGASWPAVTLQPLGGVRIRYTAGYGGAEDVPATYKQAVLLTIGHWYENREAVLTGAGLTATVLPLGVDALLLTDRGSW